MQILLAIVLSLGGLQAGTPPQTPPPPTTPSQTPPPASAPKKPAQAPTGTAGRDKSAGRPNITVTVTNMSGRGVEDVMVRASGPVDREARTDANGAVMLRNMSPGAYRLRFEHGEFITLERELTHGARGTNVSVALSAAPSKPAAEPEPPPKVEASAAPALPPAGPPTFVSIPDFVEKNYVGGAPQLTSPVGCVPSASSKVVQLREPLAEHSHENADELLYVVAGEGTHKIKGNDIPLDAGMFVTVPRGTPHSITRKGRNPIIVLSIVTEPCQQK
jgi:mannose-6-phosphate isomerase-like protein (cupin superfamily)